MSRPPSPRILLPTNQHRTPHIRQRGNLTITQADIQMLPLARLRPRQQGRHDRIACIQPRRQIRHGDSHLHRRTIPRARQVHQAKLRLDHDVEAGAITVRARLAVTRDAGVNQARVEPLHRRVVEVVFLEGVR